MNMLKPLVAAWLVFGFAASAHAEDLVFLLQNETSVNITGLQISHTSTNRWEENLMAGDVLRPREEAEIVIADGMSVCEYDLLISFSDDTEIEDMNVDLCELESYAAQE